jgi:hydrogenase nickel incorporation protein HypB
MLRLYDFCERPVVNIITGHGVDLPMHFVQVGMEYDVLKENAKLAHKNYRLLKEHGIMSVDFMGSIGSGKTTLIIRLAEKLRAKGLRVCAIAGDVTGDDDFARMEKSGMDAVNSNTGSECHLDANLVAKALEKIDLSRYDVLFIENVGNLVCPADFPLGTDYRAVVISTTEGDDMVRKHHSIFLHSDLAILNKMDIADAVDVDPKVIMDDYSKLTGGLKPMYTCSAKKDMGLDEIVAALKL